MATTTELELNTFEPEQKAIGTVIWMHGLGADNHNFDTLVPELCNHGKLPLRFIFPNAPVRPITVNGQAPTRAWYDVYSLTDLEHEDHIGIAKSQIEINRLIDIEIERGIPIDRIVIGGYSQGGAMALHTGLSYSKQLAGILALSCYLPLSHLLDQSISKANINTPIFIAHGLHDDVLPYVAGKMTHALLRSTHPILEWHEYPMGHEICSAEVDDLRKWLTKIYT